MKHYLLTWYGLTDLRAALGFEGTDGPVLSALRTGDYSDVVILGYTNPAKQKDAFVGSLREEWEEWVTAPESERSPLSREQVHRFVDAVSNTESGHEFFAAWLNAELAARGIAVEIQFIPQELTHLNDASGIYMAASTAVRVALSDPASARMTTYVSPGTPVMAYTWALIARSNPQLNIGVISNSDPRMPPEPIELPKALLDSSIRPPGGAAPTSREYDLAIHLLGEQTIPVFFGMRQLQADNNLILTTDEYATEARRLAKAAGFAPTPVVIPDAFRPADTREAIAKQVSKLPARAHVAVNMTGGTKLMFAGALSACWQLGLDPFYFEIRHHNVIFLRDGTTVPFVGISDVEDFIKAHDFRTISPGLWDSEPAREERLLATQAVWQHRECLGGLYTSARFREFLRRRDSDHAPFSFTWKRGEASLDMDGSTCLILDGDSIEVPAAGYFKYLSGGWLEEYVYSLLRPLEEVGLVRDVRLGFEAGYRAGPTSTALPAQEFDCAFTDGKRLWIVECKAGSVTQDAIHKLENSLKHYGGVAARGILVSSFPLPTAHRNRIATLPNITAVPPGELSAETLGRLIQRA